MMTADALRSVRTLFLSSLLIMAIWLLAWPNAVKKLNLYQQTLDLHAWISLRDAFTASAFADVVFDLPAEDEVKYIVVEEYDREGFGDTYEVERELKAKITWPSIAEIPVTLKPLVGTFASTEPKTTRAYSVVVNEHSTFRNYAILFIRNRSGVVPRASLSQFNVDASAFRVLEARLSKNNSPMYWDNLAPYLSLHGFTDGPNELNSTSKELVTFQAQIDPRVAGDVEILGVKLSIALFFSSVGILLAGVSFALFGPINVLRKAEGAVEHTPWVFVSRLGNGWAAKTFDIILTALGIAWGSIPAVILYLQHSANVKFNTLESFGLWLGSVGLLFSIAMCFYTTYLLNRLRNEDGVA